MTKMTPAACRDLEPGQTLTDHEVAGLQLRANQQSKSFTLRYWTRTGKERRPTLGRFPELSLSDARRMAKEMKQRIAMGEDPVADWEAQKAVLTVAQLCDRYLEEYLAHRRGPAAYKQQLQLIEAQIKPGLGHLLVTEVTTAEVDAFLAKVYRREFVRDTDPRKTIGPTAHWTAHHTRTCLRQMFKAAMEFFQIRLPVNPATGLPVNPVHGSKNYKSRRRRRHALPVELQRIRAALDFFAADQPLEAACVWTLFLCGGRVMEINNIEAKQLRVKQVDKPGQPPEERWVVHLSEHKTFEHVGERDITLPTQAVVLLKKLGPLKGRIFGVRTRRQLERFWERVREVARCPGLQLRDARRTFASYGISNGLSLEQVGDLLGHTMAETTEGYAYLLEEIKERSTDLIAGTIERIATQQTEAPQ